MSNVEPPKPLSLPFSAVPAPADLDELIERIVQKALAQVGYADHAKPFINSKTCAHLIEVTPEHLCAMRARGEGPPWSGEGKWIRYERRTVLEWIRNLPRQSLPALPGEQLTPLHDQRIHPADPLSQNGHTCPNRQTVATVKT